MRSEPVDSNSKSYFESKNGQVLLGFHRSTIYREIERRSNRLGYMPFLMERKLAENRKRGLKLDSNKQLRSVAGRLKLENKGKSVICTESINFYRG